LHDGIHELGRARTLDDLLEETAELTGDGARIGRRRVYTAADLDAFAESAGLHEVIDGTTGPRIVAPREPRVMRAFTLEEAAAAGPVDYGLSNPDAIIARQDARFGGVGGDPDHVPGATYDGIEECARGARRVNGKSGGDKGPKARRTGGGGSMVGPTKVAHENWDHERGVTGGKVRPVVVGARVTNESKDALDADQTASNGEVMETVAIVMRRTGKTKAEVLAAIERMSETGMIDPDVADAIPAKPLTRTDAA
jgi:hypothetical protein